MFQHKRFHTTHFFSDQTDQEYEFFALNRNFANFY